MKLTRIIIAGCGILSALLLIQGCKKDLNIKVPENPDLTNQATVQVYNSMLGSNRTYVFMDGAPVTGAALGYGTSFPASAYSFRVPAGLRAFVIKDTQANSLQQQLVFSENFQANKSYTVFVYDTTTVPKQVTVPTNIQIPNDTTARVRFANFEYNPVATLPVDVWSVKRKENVWSGIIRTQVTDFIPFASAKSDTLLVRVAGTTTLLAQLNAFNPTQKRSYTVVYRGWATKAVASFANY